MLVANWRWTKDIEARVLDEIHGLSPVVHICSGSSRIGDIRLDRWFSKENPAPNVLGDMARLPVRSGIAKAVICDPPYDMKRHGKALALLVPELARITAPGGKVIFLCPWILQSDVMAPVRFWLRPAGIDKGAFPNYKILSVSIKTGAQLTDF